MNNWETIEKIVNTLPQWDVIKLIMGIQEELKCAKEDNLYQLRQNKNLQNRIDKAVEIVEDLYSEKEICKYQYDKYMNILKESGE